jgi:hypothetical protein
LLVQVSLLRRQRVITQLPPEAEVGDLVCVFKGADTPHLLRLVDDDRLVLVGGACYIHGQMDGEAMQGVEEYVQEFAVY